MAVEYVKVYQTGSVAWGKSPGINTKQTALFLHHRSAQTVVRVRFGVCLAPAFDSRTSIYSGRNLVNKLSGAKYELRMKLCYKPGNKLISLFSSILRLDQSHIRTRDSAHPPVSEGNYIFDSLLASGFRPGNATTIMDRVISTMLRGSGNKTC